MQSSLREWLYVTKLAKQFSKRYWPLVHSNLCLEKWQRLPPEAIQSNVDMTDCPKGQYLWPEIRAECGGLLFT
jgi:hypothetical protein